MYKIKCFLLAVTFTALSVSLLNPPTAHAQTVFLIHLGSYDSKQAAVEETNALKKNYPELLSKLTIKVSEVPFSDEKGSTFRAQAGPLETQSEAKYVCNQLIEKGEDCYVVETAMFVPDSGDAKKTVTAAPPPPAPAPAPVASAEPVKPAPKNAVNIAKSWTAAKEPISSLEEKESEAPAKTFSESFNSSLESPVTPSPVVAPAPKSASKTVVELPPAPVKPPVIVVKPEEAAPVAAPVTKVTATTKPELKTAPSKSEGPLPWESSEAAKPAPAKAASPVMVAAAPKPVSAPVRPNPPAVEKALAAPARPTPAAKPAPRVAFDELPSVTEPSTPIRSANVPSNYKPSPAAISAAPAAAPARVLDTPPAPANPKAVGLIAPEELQQNYKPNRQGDVEVSEAVRVPLTEMSSPVPVAPAPATAAPAKIRPSGPAGYLGYASQNLGRATMWVQLSHFPDETSAFGWWRSVQANNPALSSGLRARATQPYLNRHSQKNVSLQIGPFMDNDAIKQLCSMPEVATLRCTYVRDIGSSSIAGGTRGRYSNARNQYRQPMPNSNMNGIQGDTHWIQFGSYTTPDEALSRWRAVKASSESVIGTMQPHVTTPPMSSSQRSLYRLRTGPFMSFVSASSACEQLKVRGTSCIIVSGN